MLERVTKQETEDTSESATIYSIMRTPHTGPRSTLNPSPDTASEPSGFRSEYQELEPETNRAKSAYTILKKNLSPTSGSLLQERDPFYFILVPTVTGSLWYYGWPAN
jgi:hypothetical protein